METHFGLSADFSHSVRGISQRKRIALRRAEAKNQKYKDTNGK